MLFFHVNNDFYLHGCTKSWKIIICCRKTTFLLKISNIDALMLSASIIASGASVDYSVENQLEEAKKSKNLDFEQKVKIDSEAPICCHEFDLSNIINWQHLGGGPLGRYFCLPRPGTFNFHLWSRFFSGFDKINNFWQQKQLLLFLSNMTHKVLPT